MATGAICSHRRQFSAGAIVFLQQLAHTVVRQGLYFVIVAASHRLIVDQRIYNCLFSRLHDRLSYRREDGGWLIERLAP